MSSLLESTFLPLNPKVHVSPTQLAWYPLDVPKDSNSIDFVDGLKTLARNGDPTLREGLAIHMYLANASMQNRAFCNNDDIQEIFGSHYVLPDLGPLGGNGLANARDFQHLLTHFDVDQSPWNIIYKCIRQHILRGIFLTYSRLSGKLFNCSQDHTPFDVVTWHGNYVPYKYAMEKFISVGSISKDHIDPSIFCILTAPSKTLNTPLADFLIFSPCWDVVSRTFHPPYYHHNEATEFMGLIYGEYRGRSNSFQPGGASYETGFHPHGVSYDEFKKAMELDPQLMRVHKGTIAFMFESSMMMTITDYAMYCSGKLHEHEPKMWDDLKAQFMNHLEEVKAELKAAGQTL
ncbi:hypothetical protein C0995_002104 [Termitomyces sp. Mi166|nr:hypothetical protein C0995_002104 [Termitomyces sp. Mi166\